MKRFKDLSKQEQLDVLDRIMKDNAKDLLRQGDLYQTLSPADQADINKVKDTPGLLCGCYSCVDSLLKNMKIQNLPIREGMIGRAMQQAEAQTYPD